MQCAAPVHVAAAEMQRGQVASVVGAHELLARRGHEVRAVLDLLDTAHALAVHPVQSVSKRVTGSTFMSENLRIVLSIKYKYYIHSVL